MALASLSIASRAAGGSATLRALHHVNGFKTSFALHQSSWRLPRSGISTATSTGPIVNRCSHFMSVLDHGKISVRRSASRCFRGDAIKKLEVLQKQGRILPIRSVEFEDKRRQPLAQRGEWSDFVGQAHSLKHRLDLLDLREAVAGMLVQCSAKRCVPF